MAWEADYCSTRPARRRRFSRPGPGDPAAECCRRCRPTPPKHFPTAPAILPTSRPDSDDLERPLELGRRAGAGEDVEGARLHDVFHGLVPETELLDRDAEL